MTTMNFRGKQLLSAAALTALVLASSPARADEPLDEEFHYRWRLSNLVGSVAGIFLPNHGKGQLTFKTQDDGHLRSELLITSPETEKGEYFRYGAEINPVSARPIRAWSSYLWRGEEKSKSEPIKQAGVMDIVSGIYSIRQDPPAKARRMDIWSDGRIYQVEVVPRGTEFRDVPAGRVAARHYTIRDLPGGRKWKGKLELWLATDEASTPVEILISRNLADVRLELVSLPAGARAQR